MIFVKGKLRLSGSNNKYKVNMLRSVNSSILRLREIKNDKSFFEKRKPSKLIMNKMAIKYSKEVVKALGK